MMTIKKKTTVEIMFPLCLMQVAACELLHSLVIYMVGKSAQMVEGENSLPPMYKLHKRLFPVLLRLACDVDQVCALHQDSYPHVHGHERSLNMMEFGRILNRSRREMYVNEHYSHLNLDGCNQLFCQGNVHLHPFTK